MAATYSPSTNDHVVKVWLDDQEKSEKKEDKTLEANGTTKMPTTTTTMKGEDAETTTTTMMMMVEEEGKSDEESSSSSIRKEEERQSWSRKREYILTLMGYIVGIGNVWRFPYMCNRNGGGAYLFPFILCLALMGFPLFFLETALGQFTGKSPLHVWSICPLVKGVGVAMCIVSIINFWYFNTIMSWALYYMVSSLQSVVPWSLCGQWWNTPQCTDLAVNANATSARPNATSSWNITYTGNLTAGITNYTSAAEIGNKTDPLKIKVVTAAEEFWQHNVLQVSGGFYEPGHVVWYLAIMQCIVLLFIFFALLKGVKSSGKVVYVTATAPYVVLIVLLVRGVTLPGAVDGILFYITPDFERLLDPVVWVEAALQVFYSLGPAWGGLIAMASYNKFDNNCLRDAFILSFLGEGTSVFGGFAIFSVLGYMARQSGLHVSEVVSAGPGLVFIVYPEAISLMPLPQLWSILFFFMIITLVIDTQLAGGETILTIICDSFPHTLGRRRILVTGSFCVIALVSSLVLVAQGGIYVFQLFDWFIATLTVTSIALTECVVVAWIYGADRFGDDIQMMLGRKPPMIINILWCFINPILLVIILVVTLLKYKPPTYAGYQYDTLGTVIGWGIALVSFIPIPVMAVYQMLKAKGSFSQRLKQMTTPDETWGPADLNRRLLYRKEMLHRMPRQRFLDVLR